LNVQFVKITYRLWTLNARTSKHNTSDKNDFEWAVMRHTPPPPLNSTHYFFMTSPMPCPYFSDRVERRLITELVGPDSQALHDQLTRAGFRRSHGTAYAQACSRCNDCIAIRIKAREFSSSRSQRRIAKRNKELVANEVSAIANEEQFILFEAYQASRHAGGDMETMDYCDYQSLVEENTIDTAIIEFRHNDRLVACIIVDKISDGFSAVYSFFDTEFESRRSLGTFMILWLIEHTRALELDYVYLGFWINNCQKMSYKKNFIPLEYFLSGSWEPHEDTKEN
jgi:arginyl-tRNA--protein-N-Asp/Glu arginylyltransferase